mmetsp:Transcript_17170/g.28188  ORF Transcript_17170/g.28188 Transcript_17170/m.28188 type:complete len:216 (+) Transcript_17170:231-878(+)
MTCHVPSLSISFALSYSVIPYSIPPIVTLTHSLPVANHCNFSPSLPMIVPIDVFVPTIVPIPNFSFQLHTYTLVPAVMTLLTFELLPNWHVPALLAVISIPSLVPWFSAPFVPLIQVSVAHSFLPLVCLTLEAFGSAAPVPHCFPFEVSTPHLASPSLEAMMQSFPYQWYLFHCRWLLAAAAAAVPVLTATLTVPIHLPTPSSPHHGVSVLPLVL